MVAVATILVVDDEPRIVQLVRDYLEHGVFTVLVAADGAAALRSARTGRPDLLVLVLGMPGLDGLDVARALRRDGEGQLIMLPRRTEVAERLGGLEIGAGSKKSRKKMEPRPRKPCHMVTVFGAGYRCAEPTAWRSAVGPGHPAAAPRGGGRANPCRLGVGVVGAARRHSCAESGAFSSR